jgi:toxin ParE1/3/4
LSRPGYALRPAAGRELRENADYLRVHAGPEEAVRFVDAARRSFARLAERPGIGSRVPTRNPQLVGLRKWRVEGFPRILIFYLPQGSGVRIIHLLHAAADWQAFFDAD